MKSSICWGRRELCWQCGCSEESGNLMLVNCYQLLGATEVDTGIFVSHPGPHAWACLSETQDWIPAPWQVSVVSYKWICNEMPQATRLALGYLQCFSN